MATWNLTCAHCREFFQHSVIEDTLPNFYLADKPAFPRGGSEIECPNCGRKAVYQRNQLQFREETRERQAAYRSFRL